MGIDIYAHWDGQTEEELDEQYRSIFENASPNRGYLREAYHGEPYATHYLLSEVFESGGIAYIPAMLLRERLPETIRLAKEREQALYNSSTEEIDAVLRRYREFVELCERMEEETGRPARIHASW